MTSPKFGLLAALPLLIAAVPAAAQTPAAQSLSLAKHPAVTKNVRSGATMERKNSAAGNTFGYVIGAIAAAAFIYGGYELISGGDDDDDFPASP